MRLCYWGGAYCIGQHNHQCPIKELHLTVPSMVAFFGVDRWSGEEKRRPTPMPDAEDTAPHWGYLTGNGSLA